MDLRVTKGRFAPESSYSNPVPKTDDHSHDWWPGDFQANIEKQKLYKGGRNADAFIVARAYAIGGTVVTAEQLKPNAVKVPNICKHFGIPCLDLEGFMEEEGWQF